MSLHVRVPPEAAASCVWGSPAVHGLLLWVSIICGYNTDSMCNIHSTFFWGWCGVWRAMFSSKPSFAMFITENDEGPAIALSIHRWILKGLSTLVSFTLQVPFDRRFIFGLESKILPMCSLKWMVIHASQYSANAPLWCSIASTGPGSCLSWLRGRQTTFLILI